MEIVWLGSRGWAGTICFFLCASGVTGIVIKTSIIHCAGDIETSNVKNQVDMNVIMNNKNRDK